MEQTFGHLATHIFFFLSGSAALGIVSHAVNTFPTPKTAMGRWFLGVIQYAVGQRMQAYDTLNGKPEGTANEKPKAQ